MTTDMATDTALRVTCSKAELASALGVVARAVSTRGAVQVLGGILLEAENDRLTLSATDMEISLRASVGGEIGGDASVVVPGRLFTDLVRLLPADTVTLAHEEGEGILSVTSGSHSSRLNVYRKPAGTPMVTPDIGSGRSFGTEKLSVRTTPAGRACGTGTTCAAAPPDAARPTARAQNASAVERTCK